MKFTWDEAKCKINIKKHGLDFADAKAVFAGLTATIIDNRFDYAEERFITIGWSGGKIVVIAHTEHNDIISIISMRKATKYEQKIYFQEITN